MHFSKQTSKRLKIDLVVLTVVLIGGGFAVLNAKTIGDWVYFAHYKPTPEIQKLAEAAGMNNKGKRLFYRFDPMFVSVKQMQGYCGPRLGCTNGIHIYILRSNDANYNRSIVTAAHEMLHVAYSRLSKPDRQRVNDMLNQELAYGPGKSTAYELEGYDQKDKINEAHSYMGSEASQLSPDLETYYKRYFSDRSKTTNAFIHSPEGVYGASQ